MVDIKDIDFLDGILNHKHNTEVINWKLQNLLEVDIYEVLQRKPTKNQEYDHEFRVALMDFMNRIWEIKNKILLDKLK